MKIILTSEVSGLGTPGDIVEVKDGYGRNYLLPQGFAIGWTKGAEKQVTSIKRARSARAGAGGRLFGSVTPTEVQQAVKAAGGPDLDKRRIELPGHIKAVGQYT